MNACAPAPGSQTKLNAAEERQEQRVHNSGDMLPRHSLGNEEQALTADKVLSPRRLVLGCQLILLPDWIGAGRLCQVSQIIVMFEIEHISYNLDIELNDFRLVA